MAASLPLELQQQIFQYLDPRSFHASRNVCRWWRHASQDSVALATQLRQLPVHPPVSVKALGSERLQSLYDDAARVLMLGMRVNAKNGDGKSLSARTDKAKIAVSRDGRRAATLDNRQITLHDLESPQCAVISQRPINDLRTAVGGGPWFKCAPTSVYELALSSNGNILAVALERTIQIYDLTTGEDSWPVSSYITSAAGHYIAGLQFQHNDSLLRVQLSNKGTVVYLGTPQEEPQGLQHWQAKGGLKHAFLDSALLTSLSHKTMPETLAGLQLLRPFANGWLFAAQKRCAATQSASYCLGHVVVSEIHGHVAAAEKLAIILTELPSAMSSTTISDIVHGIWHHLPALVQHPHFSLSADNSLLALSENVGAQAHTGSFSQVFVFRLPSLRSLSSDLENTRAMYFKKDQQGSEDERTESQNHLIQRLPLSIGCVNGKILDFRFTDSLDAGERYQLSSTTELGRKTWSLLDS